MTIATRLLRQWWTERRLRRERGSFRVTDPEELERIYGDLSAREFATINGPQHWLNERALPRILARCDLGPGPVRAIDLGCGDGGSTYILAGRLPAGSTVIGYDIAAALVARARSRARSEPLAQRTLHFRCQPITEPLVDESGAPLEPASLDIAHSAGVLGHHLDERDLHRVAAELRRTIRPGGHAVLDSGPRCPRRKLRALLREHGFRVAWSRVLLPFGARTPVLFGRTTRA